MRTDTSLQLSLVLLAVSVGFGGASGCRSSAIAARDLSPGLLARSGAGRQQIELQGLATNFGRSTAVGPEDLLDVTVLTGLDTESREPQSLRVGDDGYVDVPLVGRVAVAGSEPNEAAQLIAAAAVKRGVYLNPQVNVVVANQATNRVTVLGAVTEPGVKEVPRNACDIIGAIAAAGGFSETAGTVVEVLRSSPNSVAANGDPQASDVQQVAYDAALPPGVSSVPIVAAEKIDLGNPQSQLQARRPLGDRDVVVVRPREKRVVHVSGLVKKPDQFELADDHDLTVLDAIARAGGVTTNVADSVLLLRQVEGQPGPVAVRLSISGAKRNGAENLLLQAGDMVSVEPTVTTTIVETFTTLFRITMGVGGNLSLF